MTPTRTTKPEALTPKTFRAARLALHLTQAELAATLGISKTEAYRKEAGLRKISTAQALAIRGLLQAQADHPGQPPRPKSWSHLIHAVAKSRSSSATHK